MNKFKFLFILIFSLEIYSFNHKPNIIIILTDDLGWGDVSYNSGSISTPNIDKLAKDGLLMNRFYSAPTCSPTRASLMTGINSIKNGVVRPINNPIAERNALPLRHKIMPEYFKEAGYQTALSGKWHLGMFSDEYLPGNRGFDYTYGHLGGGIDYFEHTLSGRLDWHRNAEVLYEDGYSTTLIADEAVRIIKNRDIEKPLFLYVAFNAPHTPIQAEVSQIEKLKHINDKSERLYAANIQILDKEIGKIISSIESEKILEETIIIFFSDNGPVHDINPIVEVIAPDIVNSKGNTRGLRGSKGSTYEGGIRVPGIIFYKGKLEKKISDQFFFVDDLLPTLLSASKIKFDKKIFTGVNRWQDLLNNNIVPPSNVLTGNIIINDERALFNDNWKLYFKKNIYINSKEIFELYDIINDPYERKELSSDYPEIFESMKETLNENLIINDVGFYNGAQAFLYGDRYTEISESPWLDRNYEEKDPPSSIIQFIILSWILIIAYKEFFILIIMVSIIYLIQRKSLNKSNH